MDSKSIVKSDGKQELSLTLDQSHIEWLQEMTRKHDLPTVGKALRIVILYAREQEDQEEIFQKVRCTPGATKKKVTEVYLLDKEHSSYLEQAVSSHKLPDVGKAIRIILDYAISRDDADTIFGVKRCKHGITCGCAN